MERKIKNCIVCFIVLFFMGFTTVKADTFGSLVVSCPIENVSVSLYRVADTEMNLVSPFSKYSVSLKQEGRMIQRRSVLLQFLSNYFKWIRMEKRVSLINKFLVQIMRGRIRGIIFLLCIAIVFWNQRFQVDIRKVWFKKRIRWY